MKMIKVLIFVDRLLHGGIQTFLLDYYTRFDKDKFDLSLLVLDDGNTYPLEGVFEEAGIKLYKLNNTWITSFGSFLRYKKNVSNFFKSNHDFDIVHLNSSGKNYYILKCAKENGIKIRIAHSHNIDFQTESRLKKIIGKFFNRKLNKYATNYFGCSTLANKWMFSKKNFEKAIVIPNAIDCSKFLFNTNVRKNIRTSFDIDDETIVIGNVARFVNQKNHSFLIDIFYEYHKLNSKSKLLLVGEGELHYQLLEKCKKLNINDNVIFAGYHLNANDFYNAMDVFVFPSLYEGLGITVVEAEANGLPCYISSEVIPSETHLTSNLISISLKDSSSNWANTIYKNRNIRVNEIKKITDAMYEINAASLKLQNLFISLMNRNLNGQ